MADHHEITGALAVLREAMRASPVPPADILGFAVDCCSAAGFPPTTPELDDKLRALGLLFGKAAPGPADLTHFLWHVLDGNIPRPLLQQALEQALSTEFKGLAGEQVRAVLTTTDLGSIYGSELIKNLGLIIKSIARRAVEMTTAGMEGEVAAERAERTAAMSTIRALEADLTKIASAYYGEEAPTGIAAEVIAEFIKSSTASLKTISDAYTVATGRRPESTSEIAEHITALTGSDKALSWFQDLWGRTTLPSSLVEGSTLAGRRFSLLTTQDVADSSARDAALLDVRAELDVERRKVAELRAEVENLQGLLGADAAERVAVVAAVAVERMQADAREIGRLRAANRDLSAKIESAPGSGLRKRLAVAERIAGHPGELGRRQVELEKIQGQIREAKAQRDAVLAAARKDPTGKDGALKQERSRYEALALAVCPFPKEHDKLLQQAKDARDRAAGECAKGLPDGYRIEEATSADQTLHGWRWTVGSGTWGETVEGPGYAVRLAWQRLVSQIEAAHREAVRHAEKRLAELEGPAPIRSVLIAAVEALGWTPAAGDPEDWAIAEGRKLAVDRKALSDLRGIIDATQVRVSTSQHPVGSAGWIAEMGPHVRTIRERHGVRLGELARHLGCEVAVLSTFELGEVMGAAQPLGTAAMDALQAQPGPTARGSDKPSPVQDIRVGANEPDMQRIRDLLHERRARLAMRDGEACTWPELVKGLIDDSFTADLNEGHMAGKLKHAEERAAACAAIVSELEAQLAVLRGKGPSAADTLRGGWESEKFVATATRKATIECAVGWPPRMEHPGRLVITIDRGEASHSLPTVALWYRDGAKTWALGQTQVEPMRPGDTMSIEYPLGPKTDGESWAERDQRLAELDAAWAKTGYAQPLTAESLKYVTARPPVTGLAFGW